MQVRCWEQAARWNPHPKSATCGTEVPNSLNNHGITGIFKGNTFIQEIDRNYRTKG
ncbi:MULTISPECIES: hypothetical protein [Paenibacillus]|uniref:hypothetical protein n=1 Tax=Paenibacillus TaxID=44249 RepID=UPI0015C3D992|nr:hypothetical protein [Paenibacillus lautus]